MARASQILTSKVIARPGRSAPRASVAGWRAASRRLADEPITLEELAGEFGVSRERVR
jgi:hypothetical protein